MADDLRKLELRDVLQADAAEIVAARTKALLIHRSGDIDAAGDEVEEAVRTVLRRKLPLSYYVGHGHIIDAKWDVSPQLDVVIADNAGSPILFQSQNDTEYFPYEAVYAVGEVKSAYYKDKEYVHGFVNTLTKIKNGLRREQTPKSYLGGGISLSSLDGLLSIECPMPYRNPLFSFMLFVQSNGFQPEHILDLYRSTPRSDLPNILCFLDSGVVVNTDLPMTPDGAYAQGSGYNLYPEFNNPEPGLVNRWLFIPFETENHSLSGNFGFLYYSLITHLKNSVLISLNMQTYMRDVFPIGNIKMKVFG